MDYAFIPKKLIETKKMIVKKHPNKEDPIQISPNKELRQLIIELINIKPNQIKKYAYVLSERNIIMVTLYLPYNYYNVDMRNLFGLLNWRSDSKLMKLFYFEWQKNYDNEQCNQLFKEHIIKNKMFRDIIMKYNHSVFHFTRILQSNNIAIAFGKMCLERQEIRNLSFSNKMMYFGISENSRLFRECKMYYYTFCRKEDYKSADILEFTQTIMRYPDDLLRIFLLNFLSAMNYRDLFDFHDICEYLVRKIGNQESLMYNFFFSNADNELVMKYKKWLNILNIEKYFNNDERSDFWKLYDFESIVHHSRSESVEMESKDYYIVEFLGQSMGPFYIYKKRTYEDKIRYLCNLYDNLELRSELFRKRTLYVWRKEHRGNWQWAAADYLEENKIVKKLD